MSTKVVNIDNGDRFDVYIGRHPRQWEFEVFSCPENIRAKQIGREEMLRRYREYVAANPDIVLACAEIKGLTLGCYCKPEPCHGDILAEIADAMPGPEPPPHYMDEKPAEEILSWDDIQADSKPLPAPKRIWEMV